MSPLAQRAARKRAARKEAAMIEKLVEAQRLVKEVLDTLGNDYPTNHNPNECVFAAATELRHAVQSVREM